ncbi:hypothetical protein CDCA_CDCA11G3186 [Cyanidium caldarium]|uniref:Tyrosine--tRNA ligase n=1 Tax=Cyanidium caldarium TaxID=2771 RepID=A0AAV9IYJ0_CYACA|nr:hypothetical protein CDCA_CDCA11G3186 [Cyanidium caldarium]
MFCTFTGTLRTGAVRRWRWLPGGCSAADAAWIAAKRTALQRPWLTCTPRRLLPSASFHSSRLRCSTPSDRSPRGQTTESPVQPGAPVDDANTNVIRALESRGLIESVTSDEIYALCRRPVSVYVGFDPTADSLHVGNLLGLLVLRWFQRFGHKPVAVMGGATARIGDPSGKSTERPLLDQHTIERNLRGIEGNLRQVLEFTGDAARFTEPLVLNNYDWLSRFSFLDFLRDVGKLARVGNMLSKDAVRTRLHSEEGISFTEFSYQLLQGYDFAYLYSAHGVTIQAGGSDQWGNIVTGTEMTRKLFGGSVYGLTFPLLTTSDGRKLGKSEKGAVWLAPDRLSPYEFYQFLFKVSDEDVCRYLRRLTFLPLEQVDALEHSMLHDADYVANTAQRLLAAEVTRLVHGEVGVQAALAATAIASPGRVVNPGASIGSDAADGYGNAAASAPPLSAALLESIASDMPGAEVPRGQVVGASVVELMVRAGLQKSKNEARRLIRNGGAYLNNERVTDESRSVHEADLIDGRLLLLAAGKKNKMLVRVL